MKTIKEKTEELIKAVSDEHKALRNLIMRSELAADARKLAGKKYLEALSIAKEEEYEASIVEEEEVAEATAELEEARLKVWKLVGAMNTST